MMFGILLRSNVTLVVAFCFLASAEASCEDLSRNQTFERSDHPKLICRYSSSEDLYELKQTNLSMKQSTKSTDDLQKLNRTFVALAINYSSRGSFYNIRKWLLSYKLVILFSKFERSRDFYMLHYTLQRPVKSVMCTSFETQISGKPSDAVALVLPQVAGITISESLRLVHNPGLLKQDFQHFMNKLYESDEKKENIVFLTFYNVLGKEILPYLMAEYFAKRNINSTSMALLGSTATLFHRGRRINEWYLYGVSISGPNVRSWSWALDNMKEEAIIQKELEEFRSKVESGSKGTTVIIAVLSSEPGESHERVIRRFQGISIITLQKPGIYNLCYDPVNVDSQDGHFTSGSRVNCYVAFSSGE